MEKIEILRQEGFYYGRQTAIAEFNSVIIARLQVICLREQGSEFVFVLQNVQIKMIFLTFIKNVRLTKLKYSGISFFCLTSNITHRFDLVLVPHCIVQTVMISGVDLVHVGDVRHLHILVS